MKKFIIILFMVLSCSTCYAKNYTIIDKIEDEVFGITYTNENIQNRLERLEKNIYGKAQSGSNETRISKLSKDLAADTFNEKNDSENTHSTSSNSYYDEEEKPDSSVDYPVIDEFEKQVFNKEFKNKKIEYRLSNLEKKVFNKTYEHDNLSNRTDRLRSVIAISKPKTNEFETIESAPEEYNMDEYLKRYSPETAEGFHIPSFNKNGENKYNSQEYDSNIYKILTKLEKKILKRTYSQDNVEERLERLEETMFSTSFSQDKTESRLERLALAWQASKSSKKYDTNKLSQHLGTAMQVGMFLLMILAMVI